MISGGLYRMKMLYPYCCFKAKISYKNVAPGKTWTNGPLFFDGYRNYYILEKNTDGEGYFMRPIIPDHVYLDTFFKNCRRKSIFEGDILKITMFDRSSANGFSNAADIVRQLTEDKDSGDVRRIDESVPPNVRITTRISGVVCYMGGMPFIQYLNYNDGTYQCTPLYQFFDMSDKLPINDCVVETLGTVTEDPQILDDIFSMELKTGYSHEVNNQRKIV